MDVRVERAVGVDLHEALAAERVAERPVDEANALLERGLVVLGRRLQRPFQVVEHGQELADEPLVRACDEALLVARDALLVVVEVGGDALEVGETLVPLGLQLGDPLLEVDASGSVTSHSSTTS